MSAPYEVLVIGAGVSGLGAAMALRRAGIDDVIVLEKANTVGGVWRDNTYPGCAVDIPSVLYCYSFAPTRDWSRTFAPQPEILAYLKDTASATGVMDKVRLGVEVLQARWDAAAALWQVHTSDGDYAARSVIAAAGPWHEPNDVLTPGLHAFPGPVFHTSRWDHTVDLTGQRVAVVGTGASSIQVIPSIADEVEHLHVFQRTPQWVLPKQDKETSRRSRQLPRRVTAALTAARRAREKATLALVEKLMHRQYGQSLLKRVALMNLHGAISDQAMRSQLTPSWDVGCKRVLMSNGYYAALARHNVSLHATGLGEVRGHVLVGVDGSEAAVDVVVLATGFKILDMPIAARVRGVDGRSLAERWGGSPQAYLGTVVHGYPNFFTVFGPNLGAVASGFTIVESQLSLIVQALLHLRRTAGSSIEVRADVQQRFNDEVQQALRSTVYNAGGCSSYYFDHNGRNGFSWPWSARRLAATVSRFSATDFSLTRPNDASDRPPRQVESSAS